MDWLLSPPDARTATVLRKEIMGLLGRHAAEPDPLGAAELVLAELLGNAVEHAGGSIWVSLNWDDVRPVVTVHDLGPLFELDPELPRGSSERGRGMWLVSHMAGDLSIAAKRAGGKKISATLLVQRREEASFDPPARRFDPMPDLAEAGDSGFGKESFLRALVVELSRTVHDVHGPATAQDMIAHVGATVGGQMEAEYRAARAITGKLTPDQIAECYLRLKAAIDGQFYVISIEPDRIVLGNHRCPFGDAVRRSPALCRMTSSVFGGIAARNHGQATVLLNERIAVGDPQCRVTVHLGAQPAPGHRYRDPSH